MALQNVYHLRRVADTAAKSCYVCYKPSSSVLITPDNKDFFYICPSHLKDRNFCSPIIDTEAVAAKKKEEAMAAAIDQVKKEWEEKQQRKKEKEKKEKSSEESKDENGAKSTDDQGKDKKAAEDDKKSEKERDEKIESIKKSASTPVQQSSDDSPRIFALHKNFYQMRIDRLRNLEVARRNRQRLQDPSFFPSVPSSGV